MKVEFDKFYVYRWIRLDTNQPFYVGKGCGRRFKLTGKTRRNSYFLNIYNQTPCKYEIFIKNLTESQSFIKEVEFIKLYKHFGFCEANLTIGGEGVSGRIVSLETRNKIKISSKERWSDREYKSSVIRSMKRTIDNSEQEHWLKRSCSIKKTKEKPFYVWKRIKKGSSIKKGEYLGVWLNQITCIKDLNIKHSNSKASGIGENLHQKRKSAYGYIFEYVGEV